MGTLTIATFMTLDGIMQAPGGPDEDRDGGFEHGGWSFPYFSDDMGEVISERVRQSRVLPPRAPDLRDLRRQLAQLPGHRTIRWHPGSTPCPSTWSRRR